MKILLDTKAMMYALSTIALITIPSSIPHPNIVLGMLRKSTIGQRCLLQTLMILKEIKARKKISIKPKAISAIITDQLPSITQSKAKTLVLGNMSFTPMTPWMRQHMYSGLEKDRKWLSAQMHLACSMIFPKRWNKMGKDSRCDPITKGWRTKTSKTFQLLITTIRNSYKARKKSSLLQEKGLNSMKRIWSSTLLRRSTLLLQIFTKLINPNPSPKKFVMSSRLMKTQGLALTRWLRI